MSDIWLNLPKFAFCSFKKKKTLTKTIFKNIADFKAPEGPVQSILFFCCFFVFWYSVGRSLTCQHGFFPFFLKFKKKAKNSVTGRESSYCVSVSTTNGAALKYCWGWVRRQPAVIFAWHSVVFVLSQWVPDGWGFTAHRENRVERRCGGRWPTSPPRPLRNSQTVAYLKDPLTLMNFWSSFCH